MGYANEIKGPWFGVEIPAYLRCFDCRGTELVGPYLSSERAEADLGLYVGDERYGTTPVSCHTYLDARTASDELLAKQVQDMVRESERLNQEYESCVETKDTGKGGSCFYRPLALCMSNYGWSVLCDRRTVRIRHFK